MKLLFGINAILASLVYAVPSVVSTTPREEAAIVVKVPTRLKVEQSRNTVDVTTAEFQRINLTFRSNLVKGTRWEANIIQGSTVIGRGGGMVSDIKVELFADILTRGQNKVPGSKAEFSYEYTLTIFETDEPATHLWSPERGKAYKVLWTKTFKELVK